jgi:GNAT superfamily N-acetyltransferase
MLRLSREEDLPLVRELIVDGAKAGSFDSALAQPTIEAACFFSGVRRVVLEHVWLRPAPTGEAQIAIPAAIWVYEERHIGRGPLGFFAVRGAGHLGYELWLTAIQSEYRNRGLGKQMVSEILATPIGRQIMVAQCDLHAIGARRLARILCQAGFQSARQGNECEWLANPNLPPSALAWLKTTPFQGASHLH